MDSYQSPAVQLFLQNSLAKAAGLLFQAGEHLVYGEDECLLKVEIASFMLETRKSLSALLASGGDSPTSRESAQSAQSAGNSGLASTSAAPKKDLNMQSPDGLAWSVPITPTISPLGAFGSSSSGGIDPYPLHLRWPSLSSPPSLSEEKSSSAQGKSSAFLTLTYAATGKKLLVAKDSIANVLQLDEGCNIFYKNGPADTADHVSECFSYIESELLK